MTGWDPRGGRLEVMRGHDLQLVDPGLGRATAAMLAALFIVPLSYDGTPPKLLTCLSADPNTQ